MAREIYDLSPLPKNVPEMTGVDCMPYPAYPAPWAMGYPPMPPVYDPYYPAGAGEGFPYNECVPEPTYYMPPQEPIVPPADKDKVSTDEAAETPVEPDAEGKKKKKKKNKKKKKDPMEVLEYYLNVPDDDDCVIMPVDEDPLTVAELIYCS